MRSDHAGTDDHGAGRDNLHDPLGWWHDEGVRELLLVILVVVWGGRLAWHICRRSRGHGEDPRYRSC